MDIHNDLKMSYFQDVRKTSYVPYLEFQYAFRVTVEEQSRNFDILTEKSGDRKKFISNHIIHFFFPELYRFDSFQILFRK